MSIRLRLAVVFAVAAAILFTLGSWLFVAKLSASLLGTIDAQLTAQLDRAGRYAPPSADAAHGVRRQAARRGQPGAGQPGRRGGSPLPGEYVVQVIDPTGPGARRQHGRRDHAAAQRRPSCSQARTQRIAADQRRTRTSGSA